MQALGIHKTIYQEAWEKKCLGKLNQHCTLLTQPKLVHARIYLFTYVILPLGLGTHTTCESELMQSSLKKQPSLSQACWYSGMKINEMSWVGFTGGSAHLSLTRHLRFNGRRHFSEAFKNYCSLQPLLFHSAPSLPIISTFESFLCLSV